MITSVGSLVGQNILDALESRRHQVTLIGLNSVAQNARNFRCDRVYLVPETKDAESFFPHLLDLLHHEKPDIILPGRDYDVIMLAHLKETYPEFAATICTGTSYAPRMMFDKYQCYQFATKHGLPFADTLLLGPNDLTGLDSFLTRNSFPLICKPRMGFGSHGVRFVTSREQIEKNAARGEILLEEYLSPRGDIERHLHDTSLGTPLFSQIPEETQYAGQTVIKPDGSLPGICLTNNTNVMGRTEFTEIWENQAFRDVVRDYAQALYQVGWCGSLNVQIKPDRQGQWKVFELSPRHTGSTSARLLLGFDEIGILIEAFRPDLAFPNLSSPVRKDMKVYRFLTDATLLNSQVISLQQERTWKAEST